MNNISAVLEKTGSIQNLISTIDDVLKTKPKALTIFAAAGNQYKKEELDPFLKGLSIPVSGGIFPKIVFKDELFNKGAIIVAWKNKIKVTNYKNIENTESIKDLISTPNDTDNIEDIGEYLIFIDSAVPKLEENLDVLYKKVGFRATFSGGGAGSITLKPIPCIITNEGLLKFTMQTIAINHTSKVTTTHGWQKQSGPHLVTSSNRTTIKTLNYEPIVDFLKKHNDIYKNQNLKPLEFSSYFNEYPIGIENIDGDILIREPIRYCNKFIQYIGCIPEYSKIHIMTGTKSSARKEVNNDLEKLDLKNEKSDAAFVFICALRDDVDSKGHSKETKMLNEQLANTKQLVGIHTIGEIATGHSRLLHLHTKSIVITRLTARQSVGVL